MKYKILGGIVIVGIVVFVGVILNQKTFETKDLGIAVDYPSWWGDFSVRELEPSEANEKIRYGGWSVQMDPQLNFYFYAGNEQSIKHVYEGLGNVIEYYGQPLKDLCSDLSFVNKRSYDPKVITCVHETNPKGLSYVRFEIHATARYSYGVGNNKLFFGLISVAHAQEKGSLFKEAGVIFPSRSEKWPGITLLSSSYGDGDSKYENGKRQINLILPTLRYSQ